MASLAASKWSGVYPWAGTRAVVSAGLVVLTSCGSPATDALSSWRVHQDRNLSLRAPASAQVSGFRGAAFEDFASYEVAGDGYTVTIDLESGERPVDVLQAGGQRAELAGRTAALREIVDQEGRLATYHLAQPGGNLDQASAPTVTLKYAAKESPPEAEQVLNGTALRAGPTSGLAPPSQAVPPSTRPDRKKPPQPTNP